MYKVAMIGPESCGKTTFGRYLQRRYPNVTLLPEIERDYVEALLAERGADYTITYDDVAAIVQLQLEQIAAVEKSEITSEEQTEGCEERVWLFDAELVVLKVWFDVVWGRHPLELDAAIAAHPMDCYLLFYPDLSWVSDPTRTRGSDDERLALFHRYEAELQALDATYYIIRIHP